MRIAIIGSGISGLSCAWLLSQAHDIILYEREKRLGGHSNTVQFAWRGQQVKVDTGFLVYNEPNYPNLTQLLDQLAVPTEDSDMSFGVSLDDGRFEYSGQSIRGLVARPRNMLQLDFYRLIRDIFRFNARGTAFLTERPGDNATLQEFLIEHRFSDPFRDGYLLPMAAAIWSSEPAAMLAFPARSFLRFFANHGLLTVSDQPQWRTLTERSRSYVEKLAAPLAGRIRLDNAVRRISRRVDGVEVVNDRGQVDLFDHVVLACHADQALAAIDGPTAAEQAILGAFSYARNRAVLHRDTALMPKRSAAWASWNHLAGKGEDGRHQTAVTYWINQLQNVDPACPVFVTLNPWRAPRPQTVIAAFDYDHPQFDHAALAAQARLAEIQGRDRLWFAGAHWGYGFHEDGLRSGLDVAAALGVMPAWWTHVTPFRQVPALPRAVTAKRPKGTYA
ncbi:MAG: FAD-dependent oxidoreductase [Alphaproteobacteria bacterium]|nr:FAD-dependent oxidoreductase [Alphaproteobacteria bacterium]